MTAWPAASSRRSRPRAWPAPVPVSGQDGDKAALNRVALGTQTVSVWKDSRALGKAAGEAAVAIAEGADPTTLPGVSKFNGGKKGVEVNAILLDPEPDHQGHARTT